jgi:ammonia channel protein AmtB
MCPSSGNIKLRASIVAAALFAVVASPQLFAFMNALLGGLVRVTTAGGAPTLAGLILHSVVYGLIVYVFMHNNKKKKYHYQPSYGSY